VSVAPPAHADAGALASPVLAGFSRAQARILRLALAGQTAGVVLDAAAIALEDLMPGAACLIELVPGVESPGFRSSRLLAGSLVSKFDIETDPPSCANRAFSTGETCVVQAFPRHPGMAEHALRAVAAGYLSAIAVPLVADADPAPIGVLSVYFPRANGPDDETRAKLESFAGIIAEIPSLIASRARSLRADTQFAELAETIPGVVYQRVVRPDGDIRYT
jgi:hypothetical protein